MNDISDTIKILSKNEPVLIENYNGVVLDGNAVFEISNTKYDETGGSYAIVDFSSNEVKYMEVYHADSKSIYYYINFDDNGDLINYRKDLWKYYAITEFYKTDTFDDILTKASAVINHTPFDTRVILTLDITEEEKNKLHRAAALKGISVDQFMEEVLLRAIDEKSQTDGENND